MMFHGGHALSHPLCSVVEAYSHHGQGGVMETNAEWTVEPGPYGGEEWTGRIEGEERVVVHVPGEIACADSRREMALMAARLLLVSLDPATHHAVEDDPPTAGPLDPNEPPVRAMKDEPREPVRLVGRADATDVESVVSRLSSCIELVRTAIAQREQPTGVRIDSGAAMAAADWMLHDINEDLWSLVDADLERRKGSAA